jgi:hypothetical protein
MRPPLVVAGQDDNITDYPPDIIHMANAVRSSTMIMPCERCENRTPVPLLLLGEGYSIIFKRWPARFLISDPGSAAKRQGE